MYQHILRSVLACISITIAACQSQTSGTGYSNSDIENRIKSNFLKGELRKVKPLGAQDNFWQMFPSLKAVTSPQLPNRPMDPTAAGTAFYIYDASGLYPDIAADKSEIAFYIKSQLIPYDWSIEESTITSDESIMKREGVKLIISRKGRDSNEYPGRRFEIAIFDNPLATGHSALIFAAFPSAIVVRSKDEQDEFDAARERERAKVEADRILKIKLLQGTPRTCFSNDFQAEAHSAAYDLPVEEINKQTISKYYVFPNSLLISEDDRQRQRSQMPICSGKIVSLNLGNLGQYRSVRDYLADSGDLCIEESTSIFRGNAFASLNGKVSNPAVRRFFYACEKMDIPVSKVNFTSLFKIDGVKKPQPGDLNLDELARVEGSSRLIDEIPRLIARTPSGRVAKVLNLIQPDSLSGGKPSPQAICNVIVPILLAERQRMSGKTWSQQTAEFRQNYKPDHIKCLKKFTSMNDFSIRYIIANDDWQADYLSQQLLPFDPATAKPLT